MVKKYVHRSEIINKNKKKDKMMNIIGGRII